MITKKKKSFVDAKNKIRIINDLLIRPDGCKRIVGLAGPDFIPCVERWMKKGFEHITIYENNVETFAEQSKILNKVYPHINVVLGDILDVDVMENVFYDLDLDKTINNARNLERFQEYFMLTTCLRGSRGHAGEDRNYVENRFFEMRGEKIVMDGELRREWWTDYPGQKEIVTDKGIYQTTSYSDGAPMLAILKL